MTLEGLAPTGELPAVHEAWLPREHALYRPRHAGRQWGALICALIFFAAPTLMWVFGARPQEIENHRLAGFPGLSDGWGFFSGFDAWATDNLVFRDDAVRLNDVMSSTVFGELPSSDQNGRQPAGPLPGTAGGGGPTGGPATPYDQSVGPRVIAGTNGWLYLAQDMGSKCYPSRPLDQTVDLLRKLRSVVEDSGRVFVLVVSPDKSTMVPEFLPASYPNKDCAARVRDELWRRVVNEAGALGMRQVLANAERELGRPIYFPLDTHWTDEGSLAMVRSLAEQIEPGVTTSWRTAERERYSVPADLPPLIGRTGNRDGTLYQLRPNGVDDRLQNPHLLDNRPEHRRSAPTTGTIDRSTLLLGDSFMVTASPYIAAVFTDLTMLSNTSADSLPTQTIDEIANNKVVVFELVERSVAVGFAPWLNDKFIDQLRTELAKRPIR